MTKSKVATASSWALLMVAASSLLSMIGLTQIDRIVNHTLYMYGLQFSYNWAIPYWTMTTIVFAVGWFNIIMAITFQLYVFLSRRREAELPTVQEEALKSEVPIISLPAAEEKQAEEAEKPKETQTPAVEAEQKPDENKEETPKMTEGPAQYEPSEAKPPEEEQKEQEAKPAESSEPKPEVASTSPAEKQPETQEKSEETPTLVGVS